MPRRPHTPADGIRIGSDIVGYLSHTLGSSNGDDSIRRHDNIANAGRWLNYLVDAVPWIITMPWYPYVSLNIQRERGFADQLRFIRVCNVLLLCGDIISSHMEYEIERAERYHVAIVDLTDFGYLPPAMEPGSFGKILTTRYEAAVLALGTA